MAIYYAIDHSKIDSDLVNFPLRICIESSTGFLSGVGSDYWKRIHVTVDSIECFTEILEWDTVNERAILISKIPFVSSDTDTIVKISIGGDNDLLNTSSPVIVDSFTGVDDDQWDSTFWNPISDSSIGSAYISSNEGLIKEPSTKYGNLFKASMGLLRGDFDIQIEITSLTGQSSSDNRCGLMISNIYEGDWNTGIWCAIQKRYVTPNGTWFFRYNDGGSNNSYSEVSSSVFIGLIRLVRVGDQISAYFKESGGSWTQVGSTITWVSDDCYFGIIMFRSSTTPTADYVVKFDDLTINSCDEYINPESNNYTRKIVSPIIYDPFTGEDGDDPLKALWTKTVELGTDYLFINSNTLNFHSPGDGSNHKNNLISNFTISGDFDIQIDVTFLEEIVPSTSTSYSADLRTLKASDPTYAGRVGLMGCVLTPASPTKRFRASGATSSDQFVSRSSAPTKLRLTRIGSNTKAFYWKDDQWQWDGDTNGIVVSTSVTESVVVQLYFEQEPDGEIDSQLDNFQINSCDQIEGFVGETGELPAKAVWDNNFVAVYQMVQDPSGGANCILDSTVNSNHGTPVGSMTSDDLIDVTEVGKALDFDGIDDAIEISNDSVFSPGSGVFTIEAVCKTAKNYSSLQGRIWSDYGSDSNLLIALGINTDNKSRGYYRDADGDNIDGSGAGSNINDGELHYLSWVRESLTSGNLYLDGSVILSPTNGSTGSIDVSGGQGPRIACWDSGAGNVGFWEGLIGEIKLSKINRSSAWNKASALLALGTLISFYTPSEGVSGNLVIGGVSKSAILEKISFRGLWRGIVSAKIIRNGSWEDLN